MSVRIPPDSEKSSLVRIEGDPQGVRQAKRELLDLASRMVRPAVLLWRPTPPVGRLCRAASLSLSRAVLGVEVTRSSAGPLWCWQAGAAELSLSQTLEPLMPEHQPQASR